MHKHPLLPSRWPLSELSHLHMVFSSAYVGGILFSSIRRQLLTGVSMIYAINITTGMTTDILVIKLQDSVTSGTASLLDSMMEKRGLSITGVSGLILLNTSSAPSLNLATLHTPSGNVTLRIPKMNTVGVIPSIHRLCTISYLRRVERDFHRYCSGRWSIHDNDNNDCSGYAAAVRTNKDY